MPESALCENCAENVLGHLIEIAEMWTDLEERLTTEGSGWGQERVKTTKDHGIVINEPVVNLRAEVVAWTWFVARLVMDERNSAGPEVQTIPALLRWISQWHGFWLVRHPDNALLQAIATEAHEHQRNVRRRAYPSSARKVDLPHVRCTGQVYTTDEHGEVTQTGCPGTMFAIVNPDAIDGSDLICSENPEHTVAAAEWRKRPMLPQSPHAGQRWLTPAEAAALLGVKKSQIYVLARNYSWHRCTIQGGMRFARDDVAKSRDEREGRGLSPSGVARLMRALSSTA